MRPDGTVKVLDFGLAKALAPPSSGEQRPRARQLADDHGAGDDRGRHHPRDRGLYESRAGTRPAGRQARRHLGVRLRALRNAHRPPGLRGRNDDRHARVGRAARAGLVAAAGGLPPAFARCSAAACRRIARERLRDIGDARLELAATATSERGISTASPRPRRPSLPFGRDRASRSSRWRAWPRARLGAAAAWLWRPAASRPRPHRPLPFAASITLPPSMSCGAGTGIVGCVVARRPSARLRRQRRRDNPAVSPAARSLRVDPAGRHRRRSRIRSSRPTAAGLASSPTSRLKKVSLDGGAPVALADVRTPRGEAWLPDGRSCSRRRITSACRGVGARRRAAAVHRRSRAGEMSHRWPRAIPGGSAVLFTHLERHRLGAGAHRRAADRRARASRPGRRRRLSARRASIRRPAAATCSTRERKVCWPRRSTPNALAVTGPPVPDGRQRHHESLRRRALRRRRRHARVCPGHHRRSDARSGLGHARWAGDAPAASQRMGQFSPCRPMGRASSGTTRSGLATSGLRTSPGHEHARHELVRELRGVWSPDARWIVFARGAPIRSLYRRRLTAGALDEPPDDVAELAGADGDFTRDGASGSSLRRSWIPSRAPTSGCSICRPPARHRSGPATPAPRPFVKSNFTETQPTLSPDGGGSPTSPTSRAASKCMRVRFPMAARPADLDRRRTCIRCGRLMARCSTAR